MSDSMSQLERLAQITQSFTSGVDITPVVDGLAQTMQAQAAHQLSNALVEIAEAGYDPLDFIAQPRSAMKAKRERQKLQHEQEVHEANLAQLRALQAVELALKQGSVDRINGPVSVPVLAD